jgi:hypothetical protein
VVDDVLCRLELVTVAVGWRVWVLLVVGGVLFGLLLSVGVLGWHGLVSVAVCRWRKYCMMLVVGLL